MYESFFALRQRPFSAAPLVSRYVPVAGLEQARRTLSRCIERAEGPALVIGPAGSGKTLLCYLLADEFQQRFQPVLLFSGHLATRRDLLQAILFELGLPYRGLEEGELRLALIDHLTRSPQCPSGILLIVDEAHALPLKLLEELRMITNVVRGGQPRVRLVLVGGPALEERLASPKLESFSQRLAARCYLESLDRAETCDYVRAQIHLAGGDPQQVFSQEALEAIYKGSDGIPRLINQISDHALLTAAQAKRRPVDAATIEKAWSNLQQLPSPWTETAADRTSGFVAGEAIEFGDLDDDEPVVPLAEPSCALPVAEDAPQTRFAPSPVEDLIADELRQWGAGATEVELEFDEPAADEPAAEPSELFEINLSLTSLPAASTQPQWHSTEYYEPHIEDESEPEPVLPHYERESVSDYEVVEEVVVDRYATLDALKRQGRLPSPQTSPSAGLCAAPACDRPLSISTAVEKHLTLAEALVQHAATMEHAAWHGPVPAELHSSEVAVGGSTEAWSSDLVLSPCGEQTPEPLEQPLDGLTINLQDDENCEELPEPCLSLPVADEEPELIIIEDDPPALAIQIQPHATPVKKQEYRQLFARLRRS